MSARYQFLAQTKASFAFLSSLGFRVESEREGDYSFFKDGFKIVYASKDVTFRVTYYDIQLEVDFEKGKIVAPYLFLDQNLHANASGWAGTMFDYQKIAPIIDEVAKDIEMNYGAVLCGDHAVWQKIEKFVLAPKEKTSVLPLP